MHPPDFLHKDAETKLCEHYIAAGAVCSLSTNSEQVLDAARHTFCPTESRSGPVDLRLRFWVDATDPGLSPWPKPYVRGLDHLVFAGFDEVSSMLADLRTRSVIGRFSAGMAADTAYWKTVIFPMLLSILAGSVGLVELHASCVAKNQRGLVLIGPSGSGKSTLAMAMTEAGFSFLSDDRIFCSHKEGRLLAWGMPRPLKLRREAAEWFEQFRDRQTNGVQDGELVFHCEPNQQFGRQRVPECEPSLLVFLERRQGPGFCMTQMARSEARHRIELDLMAENPEAVQKQAETIDKLLAGPCWRLQYGGRPQVIAEQLARHAGTILNTSRKVRQHGVHCK
jgi:gluconate kinase